MNKVDFFVKTTNFTRKYSIARNFQTCGRESDDEKHYSRTLNFDPHFL